MPEPVEQEPFSPDEQEVDDEPYAPAYQLSEREVQTTPADPDLILSEYMRQNREPSSEAIQRLMVGPKRKAARDLGGIVF